MKGILLRIAHLHHHNLTLSKKTQKILAAFSPYFYSILDLVNCLWKSVQPTFVFYILMDYLLEFTIIKLLHETVHLTDMLITLKILH